MQLHIHQTHRLASITGFDGAGTITQGILVSREKHHPHPRLGEFAWGRLPLRWQWVDIIPVYCKSDKFRLLRSSALLWYSITNSIISVTASELVHSFINYTRQLFRRY